MLRKFLLMLFFLIIIGLIPMTTAQKNVKPLYSVAIDAGGLHIATLYSDDTWQVFSPEGGVISLDMSFDSSMSRSIRPAWSSNGQILYMTVYSVKEIEVEHGALIRDCYTPFTYDIVTHSFTPLPDSIQDEIDCTDRAVPVSLSPDDHYLWLDGSSMGSYIVDLQQMEVAYHTECEVAIQFWSDTIAFIFSNDSASECNARHYVLNLETHTELYNLSLDYDNVWGATWKLSGERMLVNLFVENEGLYAGSHIGMIYPEDGTFEYLAEGFSVQLSENYSEIVFKNNDNQLIRMNLNTLETEMIHQYINSYWSGNRRDQPTFYWQGENLIFWTMKSGEEFFSSLAYNIHTGQETIQHMVYAPENISYADVSPSQPAVVLKLKDNDRIFYQLRNLEGVVFDSRYDAEGFGKWVSWAEDGIWVDLWDDSRSGNTISVNSLTGEIMATPYEGFSVAARSLDNRWWIYVDVPEWDEDKDGIIRAYNIETGKSVTLVDDRFFDIVGFIWSPPIQ